MKAVTREIEVPLRSGRNKKIQMRQRFELAEVDDGLATINVATQVLTPNNDPEVQAQLVQRQSEGTIRFDIDRGRIVSQLIDLDRRVTGHPNPKSSMHYRTRFSEELLEAGAQSTAEKKSNSEQRK